MRIVVAIALAFALLAPWGGGSVRALEGAALAVIVPVASSVTRLSSHEVEALFTRAQTRWSDGTPVVPFNLPTGHRMRIQFDKAVLRLTEDAVGRYWVDRRIRGLGMPPRQVPDERLMLQVIERLPGSIGYVPVDRVSSRVRVVARVVGGKVEP